MTGSVFDAAQCCLIADVVSRMNYDTRLIFWEIVPDIIPDLTVHLPALTAAVRREKDPAVLNRLSSYPLPATLSSEIVNRRPGLVTAWEKRLKAARDEMDGMDRTGGYSAWTYKYVYSLSGLTQVDSCGMAAGKTCPSVLPTLVNEAHYVQKRFMAIASTNPFPALVGQFKCLSALADWRPGPHVLTDPTTMDKWGEFWLELYQRESVKLPYREDIVLMKGIAAKALLNFLEAARKEETGIPAGMETHLLESLTVAVDVVGEVPGAHSRLRLLKWQPRDVTRFPIDRLAHLPETLLKRVKLACRAPARWLDSGEQNALNIGMGELVRWNRAGLLATCHIDLFPDIVPHVNYYLDEGIRQHFPTAHLLSHQLHRWLVRKEVAAVKEGMELLQKLEKLWQWECKSEHGRPTSRRIAWEGRIQLQRAGLATETPATFQEEILEAIKKEKSPEVRLILSFWKPEKEAPDGVWKAWEQGWQKTLKSRKKAISQTAAVAFLRPDLSDNAVAWRQKLLDVLRVLPEDIRPKMSIAELTHLVEELSPGGRNMENSRAWRFSPEDMRFHVPTERSAPAPTPVTIQTACPDRTSQKTVGNAS